jgi:putative membrane protein
VDGIFPWLKSEWKSILINRKMLIAIIVILFVPTLYSGTYLWANWDPYAHLERLPVAVVNDDVKAKYKGEMYHIGSDLVDELKKDNNFKWKFVNKAQADMGLKNNQYYFEIYIPPDFSKRATTLTNLYPTPLNLYYKVNVGSNFIASQIGRTAVDKIRTKLSQSISKNYSEVVFGNILSIGIGLSDARVGSSQITSSLKKLSLGTHEIVVGMRNQQGPLRQFSNGANQLSVSATKISKGADQLHTGVTDIKNNGINTLGNSLASLNKGTNQLVSGFVPLADGSTRLKQTIDDYQSNHPELANDAAFQQIVQITQSLTGGLGKYNSSLSAFDRNINKVNQGPSKLTEVTNSIALKLNDLSTGASKLAGEQRKLQSGAVNVNNGWNKVISSLTTLEKGENDLTTGSQKLTKQLGSGSQAIQDIHTGKPIYEMMSNPVRLKEQLVHRVPNYGTGLAPYFLSLSLFVGALLLSTVYPLRETSTRAPSGTAWFLSKILLLAVISFFHSVITNLFLINFIGLDPINKGYLYLFTFFSSLLFMSIILFLVATADNVGRFLAIILLVLQLTSSAGTFPIELTPKFFQTIHSLLPMTYTVEGYRIILSTGDYHLLGRDIFVLAIYLVVFVILTILMLKQLLKKQLKFEKN